MSYLLRMPLTEAEKAQRLAEALLANLDGWVEQCEEIAQNAIPATGNRARALHLKINILQAKVFLEKFARGIDE